MYWLDVQIYAWYAHSTGHYILDTNVCLENVALQARSPLGKFTENVPSTGIDNHKPLKGQAIITIQNLTEIMYLHFRQKACTYTQRPGQRPVETTFQAKPCFAH